MKRTNLLRLPLLKDVLVDRCWFLLVRSSSEEPFVISCAI